MQDKNVVLIDRLAWAVLAICVYAFLLGNEVFQGHFKNDTIAWCFLAKGIFCASAMMLLVSILDATRKR